jgi:hypothetical protein
LNQQQPGDTPAEIWAAKEFLSDRKSASVFVVLPFGADLSLI